MQLIIEGIIFLCFLSDSTLLEGGREGEKHGNVDILFRLLYILGKTKIKRVRVGHLRVICKVMYSCEMAKKPQKDSLQ